MDEEQKAAIAALEARQKRIDALVAQHVAGQVRFRVIAPLVRMVTMTDQGRRFADFPMGSWVPVDATAEAVGYHLRDNLIVPMKDGADVTDWDTEPEPAAEKTAAEEKPARTTTASRTAAAADKG